MSDAVSWPVLNALERRLLGVLVEKAKTTPDVYPMSINALVVGCNQKSNRDPVMNVDETEAEEALEAMMPKGLVMRVTGTRVDRWRQLLYEVWAVSKVELAVLAELLLRGPQTEGELRGRAARMEPIDDLDELRSILKPLAERKLIVYLTPERSRGTMLTYGFHTPEELARLRASHSTGVSVEEASPLAHRPTVSPSPVAKPEHVAEIQQLTAEVQQLRADLNRLTSMVVSLQQALGVATNPEN
jgi:uncharacterized protein YceH (UPF0502 family)